MFYCFIDFRKLPSLSLYGTQDSILHHFIITGIIKCITTVLLTSKGWHSVRINISTDSSDASVQQH